MERRYLREDFIGACSREIYGIKGDEVFITGTHDEFVIVQNKKGIYFLIREEKLSIDPVDPDPVQNKKTELSTRRRANSEKHTKQNSIF